MSILQFTLVICADFFLYFSFRHLSLSLLECIRVLIKHDADPRVTDDEGTTPLHLAKDDETREILHRKNRRDDEKADKIGKIYLMDLIKLDDQMNGNKKQGFTSNQEL